jgi:hypothetical protein
MTGGWPIIAADDVRPRNILVPQSRSASQPAIRGPAKFLIR